MDFLAEKPRENFFFQYETPYSGHTFVPDYTTFSNKLEQKFLRIKIQKSPKVMVQMGQKSCQG